jgi:glutamyl-tRNA synthetase
VEPFAATAIEALYRELVAAMQLKLVDLAQLTRLAITGRTASPPLFDVLALLGRDEVLTRLRAARQAIGAPA